jgi:peptidoglycan/xylan/chitin deacetylase (PgdA/CDA1 family)
MVGTVMILTVKFPVFGFILAFLLVGLPMLYMMFRAVADVSSESYLKLLCRARTIRRVVALTFDDGPHPDRTPKILDVLARHGVKATFFVIGERAEVYPDIVRRIAAEGHLIGNHTYSHSTRFPWMGESRMKEDIHWCDIVLEKITGFRPILFRPPFGVKNPPLGRAVGNRYIAVGWDVRSLDTVSRWPREKVFERVRRRIRPGSVVLLHDDREGGDALLEMILNHLEQNDYKVERFDELFGL